MVEADHTETLTTPASPDEPPSIETEELVKGVLGYRYQIQRRIGAGGMGVVYAARDIQLGRAVAIKVVAPRIDLTSAQDRLVREAQAMAKLRHANVVSVYDIGAVGDRIFIVMELVEGGTLADWLKVQPRTWRQIVPPFLQAARGLAAAHGAGFVHRDFKPENVLIGKDGVVRVTDFGVVRLVGDVEGAAQMEAGALASDTGTGAIVGTPGFIAPEILRGEPVDARADQFSFCVALYAAVHGQRPFEPREGEDRIAETLGTLRPPRRGNAPRWLERILARGLAAKGSDRWSSMGGLAATIEHRLGRRRRAWALAAITGLLSASAAVVILGRPATPPALWKPVLVARDHPGNRQQWASASRDGATLVFTSTTEIRTERRGGGGRRTFALPQGTHDIAVMAVSDGAERAFVKLGRSGRLEIWGIDLQTGTPTQRWPTTEPRPPALEYDLLDVAPDGVTLVVATIEDKGKWQLWRLDASGRRRAMGDPVGPDARMYDARWSPDGRRIARSVVGKGDRFDLDRVDVLDAESGQLVERLPPRRCVALDWLTSESLACVSESDPQPVIYELRAGSSAHARVLYVGAPYQAIWSLSTTQAGIFFFSFNQEQHLHTLDLSSKTLRIVPAGTLTDTQAGWTSDGTMVFAGQIAGRFTLMAVHPGGSLGVLQEAPVAEIPLCVLGDTIIFGRFPDGEKSYPFARDPKGEVALFRRTLASAPVALGVSKGFDDLLCAGDRAPPCYLAEHDRGRVRLVEWSPDTGARGRKVLRWPAFHFASTAALSPDGRFVARPVEGGAIERLPIDGGEPTPLPCPACGFPRDLTWAPEGILVTAQGGPSGGARLIRVLPDGTAEVLAESEYLWFAHPRVSPDGRTVAVLVGDLTLSFWWASAEETSRR